MAFSSLLKKLINSTYIKRKRVKPIYYIFKSVKRNKIWISRCYNSSLYDRTYIYTQILQLIHSIQFNKIKLKYKEINLIIINIFRHHPVYFYSI